MENIRAGYHSLRTAASKGGKESVGFILRFKPEVFSLHLYNQCLTFRGQDLLFSPVY